MCGRYVCPGVGHHPYAAQGDRYVGYHQQQGARTGVRVAIEGRCSQRQANVGSIENGREPVKIDYFSLKEIISRLLSCSVLLLILAIPSQAAEQPPRNVAPSIEQLRHKLFHIQTISGNPSMTLINDLPDDAARHNLSTKGYGKDCTDNYASLNYPASAAIVQGTHALVAVLACPAANDGGAESILALFEDANTDVPVCFSRLNLMSKDGYFYWGAVRSIEVRRYPEGGYLVIPALAGADEGDSWESFVFLHMDNQCHTTVLSSFYAGMYYDVDHENSCGGEKLKYSFINPTTLRIKRSVISCTASGEKTTSAKTINLDTRALMRQPKLRIVEPK